MIEAESYYIRPRTNEICITLKNQRKENVFIAKDIELVSSLEDDCITADMKEPETIEGSLSIIVDAETATKIFRRFRKYNLLKERDDP